VNDDETSYGSTIPRGTDRHGIPIYELQIVHNGKRKYDTFHGTKKNAKKALDKWRLELESGLLPDANKATFSEYAEHWLGQREKFKAVAPGTQKKDRYTVRKLDKYIGDTKLKSLSAVAIEEAYSSMLDDGMAPNYIRQCHVKGAQILNDAVKKGVLLKSPFEGINPPKYEKPKIAFLTEKQAARYRELIFSEPMSSNVAAVVIGISTGMRIGEVCGLLWKYVDLTKNEIEVAHSLCNVSHKLREPKAGSKRKISIDAATSKYLRKWKAMQARQMLKVDDMQSPETSVITNQRFGYVYISDFRRWFRRFNVKHGFGNWTDERTAENGDVIPRGYEGLHFHELRHTQATLLVANGVDIKTVQGRMGHAKVSTTLDMYAHVVAEKDRDAADLIGDILSGASA
jgi:integrase